MNNFQRELYFAIGIASGVGFTAIDWAVGLAWLLLNLITLLFYAFVCGYIRVGPPGEQQ